MNEAPNQSQHKPGMEVHVCNSSTREVEAGDQKLQVLKKKLQVLAAYGVGGHPVLHKTLPQEVK